MCKTRQWESAVWLRKCKLELCDNREGWEGLAGERDVKAGCLRLIHVDEWQRPMQNRKVILLQLKINKFGKRKNILALKFCDIHL